MTLQPLKADGEAPLGDGSLHFGLILIVDNKVIAVLWKIAGHRKPSVSQGNVADCLYDSMSR